MTSLNTHPSFVAPMPRLVTYPVAPDEGLAVEISQSVADAPVGRPHGIYHSISKPVIDVVIAGSLILVFLPLMAAIWLAIRITTDADPIFRQLRIGKDGQPFNVYKFCTMRPDRRRIVVEIEYDRRRSHKTSSDPRVTPVGRILRKWSLDELPQLFNVLSGDMSLVGPRPEMVSLVERYEPWQHARHLVKPGLTGLWQISGRGHKPMHECIQMDLDYIKGLSLQTDLRILAATPSAVLGGNHGY